MSDIMLLEDIAVHMLESIDKVERRLQATSNLERQSLFLQEDCSRLLLLRKYH